jgi:hypothetical protein
MATIENSRESIFWYKNNAKNATIDELLALKTRLVTNNFELCETLALLKKDYNFVYFARKIEFAKSKNALIRSGSSATKAESEANEMNEDILRQELESESNAYALELFVKHVDNVCSDIMQRISVLKSEYNKNNL